jgi:Homing endonuclease associated repeat
MTVGTNRTRAPKRDVAALFAAYLAGDSLAVIGEREGVSGERIRQLFRAAGYPTLVNVHTNGQQSQQRRAELRVPVVEAYRALESITKVAEQLGISVGLATAVLAEAGVETGRNHARPTTPLRTKVTAQFCVDVLTEAARRGGGSISEKRYQALLRAGASTDGQPWPWPSTVLSRLGARTWNEALAVAGVPECAPGAGSRGVGDDELVTLAADLRGALGRLPTPGEFGRAAKDAGLPGIQSVKRRFGSWESFLATVPTALDSGANVLESTSKSDQDRF